MLFNRVMTAPGGQLPVVSRSGQGIFAHIDPTLVSTDAALTITVAQMSGGSITYTGFTAGRVITTPTAALILAAAPDMDVGDTFTIIMSATVAFAGTFAAGTGVTLAGRATIPASSTVFVVVKKTSATTVTWTVL